MRMHSGEATVRTRMIKIIGDQTPFVVSVTDLDFEDDPTGRSETIVFRESYDSIDDAERAKERQFELSLAEGYILNPYAHGGLPPY
jgi:hypothetical protein